MQLIKLFKLVDEKFALDIILNLTNILARTPLN